MLNIQNFINKYDNWKEILQAEPYYIKIQEKDNMIMFSRTAKSDMDMAPEICSEASDLILQANTLNVLKKSLDPIPTLTEDSIQSINWDYSFGSEIISGTTAALYYANEQWLVSANGKFNDSKASAVIKNMCDANNISLEDFNSQCTYNFVITADENPILVAVIDNRMLTERDLPEILPTPNEYEHSDIAGYTTELDFLDKNCVGLMIRDNRNNRVKLLK